MLSDTDGDGLSDWDEIFIHDTQPVSPDSDRDQLEDGVEVLVTMTSPIADDSDGDGIKDGDEDLDGDGFTNLEEVIVLATNPVSGSSYFAPTVVILETSHKLRFPALRGRSYRIERSTHLDGDWTEWTTFPGRDEIANVPLGPLTNLKRFYRVVVSVAP